MKNRPLPRRLVAVLVLLSLAGCATVGTGAKERGPRAGQAQGGAVGAPTTTSTAAPTTSTSSPATSTTSTTTTVPVTAPAPPPYDPDADTGAGFEQRRGAAALARIRYDVAVTGYRVVFAPGRRGYLGVTDPGARTITVYVRPEHRVADLAATVGHEVGHAVDLTMLDDGERNLYRQLRNLERTTWYPDELRTDYSTVAGDFAEVFSACQVGAHDFRSRVGEAPDVRTCEVVDVLAATPAGLGG